MEQPVSFLFFSLFLFVFCCCLIFVVFVLISDFCVCFSSPHPALFRRVEVRVLAITRSCEEGGVEGGMWMVHQMPLY